MTKGLKFILIPVLTGIAVICGVLVGCTQEHDHVVESWTVSTPATCTEDGEETGVCTVCGEEQSQPIQATGHDMAIFSEEAATCTAPGKIIYKCNNCDEQDEEDIPMIAHVWGSTVGLGKSATCEEDGYRLAKCNLCGQEGEDPIPALGHDWSELGEIVKQPTCTEEGYRAAVCARCGKSGNAPVEALGHDWEYFYTIDAPATFDQAGSKSRHCTRCDEVTDVTAIPRLDENTPLAYELRLVRTNGDPITIAGIRYAVYSQSGAEEAAGAFEKGSATVLLTPFSYNVTVSNIPAGYTAEVSYSVSYENPVCEVVLKGELLEGTPASNVRYTASSVMYDFTFDTIATNARPQSETITLSGLLQQYKIVMLNFWDTECTFCDYEFPGMEAAYKLYEDDVAIIAIDDPDGIGTLETEGEVRNYVNRRGLSFYVVMDEQGLAEKFSINSYPTTVIIDSEGVVCLIHSGALVNPNDYYDLAYCMNQFVSIFEKYTTSPYWTGVSSLSDIDIYIPEKRES